jgi:hypothetical protein
MLEEGAMYRRTGIIVAAAAMGMLVAGTSAQAAATPVLTWSQGGTTITSYFFGTVDGVGGQTATQTFTLTNTGGSSTGTLAAVALTNTSGTAFSITSDGCSGLSLGPKKFCQVTVEYAPTTNGESDSATLTATGEHASASLPLTGQGGTADLTLSPGTLTGTGSNGTNDYNYGFGLVGSGISDTFTFTVTNSGTGTSNTLQLAGLLPNTGFTLSNDQTTGSALAPGGTSTFDLTFSATCTASTTFSTPLAVTSTSTTASPYISVLYTAECGPPITSVTAGLVNLAFNPQFVSIGSGHLAGIAVNGTLTNVSFNPPASPGALAGRLHGFTIQIPFSINAGTNAATLNCDSSMLRSYSAGYPGSTCSVSNNVLTVTQNFPPSFTFFNWGVGYSKQINYVYVGSSLPTGVVCCAYVTWYPPVVTAVH